MVQVLERKDLEDLVSGEEIFLVIPEQKVDFIEKKEKEPEKKSRLFRKHKKAICIDKVKRNLDSSVYRNRFMML